MTNFSQEAVGDDLSNTDWCYMKFDVSVQCVINFNYLSSIAPDLAPADSAKTQSAAEIMKVIRSRLMRRRRKFEVLFNGINLIPKAQEGLTGTVDAKNGAIPQSCTISQLTNNTFLCVYRIVGHYWENNDIDPDRNPIVKNEAGAPVLFNRWTETQEVDNHNYTTRTRTGKFIIRSDNADGLIADQVRTQLASVGVPKGFLRERATYTISADGLGISYTIIDKEAFKLPPPGAFSARGRYIESTPKKMGAIRIGEVTISLKGDKETDQSFLIQQGLAICASKLNIRGRILRQETFANGGPIAGSILESASVAQGMYENEIEVTMRMMFGATHQRNQGLAAFASMNTVTPGSDFGIGKTPPYLVRGTSNFLLEAAAYYDPSIQFRFMTTHTRPFATRENPEVVRGNQIVLPSGDSREVGRAGLNKEP